MPPASRGPALDPYLFYAGRFTRDAARWMMAVLAVIYLAHIGIANTQIGIIFGASLAGGFLLSVVVMLTSRAVPTRVWAIVQMLITGLAGIVLIYSSDLWLLIIGGFFGSYAASGAHLGGMSQLEQTGIAAVIPQEGRTKAYSILTMSSAAGRATGALLAGLSTLLINNLDWDPTDAYQTLLWVYVAIHLFATLVYALLSPARASPGVSLRSTRPPSRSEEGVGRSTIANPFKAKARRPILTISSLFAIDSFAGGMIFESFLSFWLFTQFGMSAAAIGGLLIASQALNMVSLALAPWVARRIGLLNTLVFTQVVSNIMLLLFAFAPTVIIAIVLWLLRSLFDEMDVPTRQAYMMGITDSDEHAIMAGSANLGRGLGRIPSATVTGWLWAGALTLTPWVASGTIKIAYDIAIWLAFRRVQIPSPEPEK
ncbi:MAG: MFS transporter [Chloroflexi bacterium]|nr:MFS transporter [Chloroflexota bacterium]